jgi:prolyl oligopeptidase
MKKSPQFLSHGICSRLTLRLHLVLVTLAVISFALAPFAGAQRPTAPSMDGAAAATKLIYPVTRKVDVVDDYFGTKVPDPYRWLEDENAAETAAWVEAQNKVTFSYLEKIPYRQKVKALTSSRRTTAFKIRVSTTFRRA